ncbi:uncharacterized protein LOC134818823 isoform X1 [Bolinopsis microptera]|uniref:uncharacterized protein LOC134818823 isoform X1 n=1 Tax=Bolinopsis microptera TaxID=2820187 RepID=UPI00307ADA29
MESDNEEGGPELSKKETKLIQQVISELSDEPGTITNGEQLFSIFTRYQVQPEKQLKMMYAVAFELSELSEKCEGEMSQHYLRLSTLATVAVQEKFGQVKQQDSSSRRGRQAKDNAKINMTSYFDLETTLLNESSDEDTSKKKKKRKKEDKVEWSDSELKETEPAPRSPKHVEAVKDSDEEEEETKPALKSKLSTFQGSRISQRKRMIDVVCIDSSSDEEPKSASKEKPAASPKVKSKSTAPLKPKLKEATKAVTKKIKKPALQTRPKAPPSVAVNGIKRLLSASDKSVAEKPTIPPKVDKIVADSNAEEPAPVTEKEKTAVKPVGVVKATPRKVPADTQRSINNVIKLDEALILNFKKGHYPTFQTSYTHLVVSQKPNNELYTDTAPQVSTILAMDGQVVSSDDLKKYSLKQFVHNDSGQFLVGEFEDNLYLLVAGVINKNKEKT